MDDVEVDGSERRSLWFASAVVTFLVLLQAPGRIVPETKFDITVDPLDYLARALTAWDPSAGFGRIQNQAVGYLFPMGAFSALGDLLAIPPWLTQRLWISSVLVISLWGAHRVARAIGIGSPAGRVVAALAYALAPATLSIAAFQSAGQLPYALAPWVLVPLLTAKEGDSPRRTAARSALWIAAMGGVNGASAFAVLPLVIIWFTTRTPGPARRKLAAWWGLGAVAATLWWLIPLVVSVRYGVRFTDYTESSAITTWTESGTEILRGTGNWLSFLQTDAGPWLPGGRALTADRIAIVGSTVLAAGGMWGLAGRRSPGRAWLLPSFVLGTTAMGVGYAGAWGGPLSGLAQDLLNGPLVPFRNVHKFAAVVRLPLALGFGHLVVVAGDHVRARAGATAAEAPDAATPAEPATDTRTGPRWTLARAVPALAVAAIVVAILPAAAGKLTAPGSFTDLPVSWREAAAWLDAHEGDQRALLVPGSSFGEYEWGRPLDEQLSTLLEGDWAVRDLIPLGGNGSTRLLDGLDQAIETGTLPPGTVASLQRAGVRYLVVRNDLDLVRTGGPRPATVRRVLQTVPELELVASFGPARGDPGSDRRLSSPPGQAATEAFRAIDIYEVPGAIDHVAAYPAQGAAVVSGGPEAVAQLDPSLTDGRAVVLAVDPGADELPDPVRIATDTARRRDVEFGAVRDNTSYTLTPDEDSPMSGEAPRDRWPAGRPSGLTSARLLGAAALRDSRKPGQPLRPERQPYAAFDGDPATAWGPGTEDPGEWLEVELDEPAEIGDVDIQIPSTTGERIGSVRVVTDQGSRTAVIGPSGRVTVTPPPGKTSTVRVVIDSIAGTRTSTPIGISELRIGGVDVERPLVVPSPGGAPDIVSLSRDRADPFNVVRRDEDGTLDRIFNCCADPTDILGGTATANPGPELDTLVAAATDDPGRSALHATATSQFGDQPAFSPSAAFDDDPATAWISAREATAPAITVRWDGAVLVDSFQVDLLEGSGDRPDRVRVTAGGVTSERKINRFGQVSVPPTETDELTIAFPVDREDRDLPRQVAVAEVAIPALVGRTAATPDRDAPADLPCGKGPRVELDGSIVPTRSTGTIGQVIDGEAVPWTACDTLTVPSGEHRLTAPRAGALAVSTATIEPEAGIEPPPASRTVEATSWGAVDRTVQIGAGDDAILATTENANDGWEATLDGERLTPIRVDGWRQGWRVPAGDAGSIHLRYTPARTQRAGLVLGLAALAVLVAAAIVGPRGRRATAWAPSSERQWSAPVTGAVVLLSGLALGGPLVLLAVPLVWARLRTRWIPTIAAISAGAAGTVTFIWAGAELGDRTGTFSGPAQGFAVLAVLAVAVSMLPDRSADEEPASSD